jgi:O-antigen ligase
MGFGREYRVFVQMDDISGHFPQWRYTPHNSVLGLLAFGGLVGFAAVWLVLSVGVFFAMRAYRRCGDAVDRAAALASVGMVVIYLLHCYGDMAIVSWHGVVLLAVALTAAGKLATWSGGWHGADVASARDAARVAFRPLVRGP